MGQIYPERESKSLEFKSTLPSFDKLIKTCVAFANGVGGKIIIGVDDKTREVIGVSDEIRNRIYDEFPNGLYDATSPNLLVEIYEKNIDGLNVIIIEVPFSIKRPVFIKNEGTLKGVYLRAGSSTRRASQEYTEELMRENRRVTYDEEMLQEDINILSQDRLKNLYKKIDTKQLIMEKIIAQSSTNAKKNHPTVAGALAFSDTPHLYVPEAIVRCTRFYGIEGRDIMQTEEIQGCIEEQIENSFQLVRSWLMRDYQLTGTKLKAKTMIPEVALREAIINAILHKKYWIPGAVKIALYDNRLEIFNPGNFPGLIDINNLGDGTTYLRNPHLARVARRLGIIEKLGTGIRLILESCKQAKIKSPEFIESVDSVKIIFYFTPAAEDFELENDKLLALFNMRGAVKLKEVEEYLHVSRNTATRRLNQLLQEGQIKRLGKGPAVRYVKK